jgi:hypothetical protein
MQYSAHISEKAGRLGKGVAHTLEAVVFAIIANPFAIVAAGIFAWLLVHVLTEMWHFHTSGFGWQFGDVLRCGACVTALFFFTLLAAGHVVLTIIALWPSDR